MQTILPPAAVSGDPQASGEIHHAFILPGLPCWQTISQLRNRMQLQHLVAAADDSGEGRAAVLTAARLGQRCGAKVTVLTVVGVETDSSDDQVRREHEARVKAALSSLPEPPRIHLALAKGLPGVEVGRFAETHQADLVVIGRKRRSELQRLLIGDTADSVVRRSRTPCLFVPDRQDFERVLVALDGTERGFAVLQPAVDFTRAIGGKLRAVIVEPAGEGEGVHRPVTGRVARLVKVLSEQIRSSASGEPWDLPKDSKLDSAITVYHGSIVEGILREIGRIRSDILVLGFRRGGPAGVIEAGSVARRLTHEAPCGVLTIPL
jgi:nucleotide-binding universal stress UspA family protein